MKAKEFIPASKPRNFVAKNQKTAGAGAHKDKKRDEKQGNVKHKRDLMPMEAGWKDEAEGVGEWTDYVKERLTKASPEQRLSLAKKLSQVEVKNFGSSLGGGFDRNTGKAKTGELTDTVRSALRSISAGRSSDGDGPAGNFSMPFGSVDIPGMENATPEELAVMKKAVMMGPQVAGAAAKLYKKNGTITSQDLKNIESGFEKASGIEFGKPMYSSPEAKASKERAMAGEGITEGSAHGYNVVRWYRKNRNSSKITAWLKKEAGLSKETKLYFDDADLVLGSDTIVPEALVDDTLKFNDLLTALVKATGGTPKEKTDGVYREKDVAEATSAAVRMQRAADRQRAKSDASLARTPSSIPKKEEPKKQGVAEGAPIVVMPRADRLKKPEPTKVRYQGDIVPPTKPPSTEKRGVKGRPGQRPMPGVAEGVEDLTPNMAKYVLDQIYNSDGAVTMTDLFDEGIPGLRDMFMATAEELGLDPDEDFMDIESAVLEKLEELVGGPNEMSERVRDPEDWDEGNTEPGNNFAVYINGKKWKVLPGPAGAYADSPEEKREFARLQAMAQRKSQETGKKWEVHVTGESATK